MKKNETVRKKYGTIQWQKVVRFHELGGPEVLRLEEITFEDPAPISLSELAAKLVCVKSNVTQLVDRLETEGLVKRANDPADRRAVRAEVTALGRKRQAVGTPVVNAVLQDIANKLAAVDSQKLKRALDAIQ
jgi:DNA-binding MarR family transcriptional regulator